MSDRDDPFAVSHGLQPHEVPDRPSPVALVARAIHGEAGRLRDELRESQARLLITLGNEALAVAASLVAAELPQALIPDSAYRTRHVVTFDDSLLGGTAWVSQQGRQAVPQVHWGRGRVVRRGASATAGDSVSN